ARTTVDSLKMKTDRSGQASLRFGELPVKAIHWSSPDTDLRTVLEETAYCVHAWLSAAGINGGFVWRRIEKAPLAAGLSAQAIYWIVTRRAMHAGLASFNPRSLRAGFMVAAAEQQVPCLVLMALCRDRIGSK